MQSKFLDLHFQSQSSASWAGKERQRRDFGQNWRYCYSDAVDADTGQHKALCPPQTAFLGTTHICTLFIKWIVFEIQILCALTKCRFTSKQQEYNQGEQWTNSTQQQWRRFTLKTRALCVVKQCCRKRALWFPAMLWRRTLRTPPRTLSFSSDATTVWHKCTVKLQQTAPIWQNYQKASHQKRSLLYLDYYL